MVYDKEGHIVYPGKLGAELDVLLDESIKFIGILNSEGKLVFGYSVPSFKDILESKNNHQSFDFYSNYLLPLIRTMNNRERPPLNRTILISNKQQLWTTIIGDKCERWLLVKLKSAR